jgi:hypothetical protein
VSQSVALDINWIKRHYHLETPFSTSVSWKNGSSIGVDICPPEAIRLVYTVSGRETRPKDWDYKVYLYKDPCRYGGFRWWFECTACHRRCRYLYKPAGESIFACRLCYRLTYKSQQEARGLGYWLSMAINKSDGLLARLRRARSSEKRQWLSHRLAKMTLLLGQNIERTNHKLGHTN